MRCAPTAERFEITAVGTAFIDHLLIMEPIGSVERGVRGHWMFDLFLEPVQAIEGQPTAMPFVGMFPRLQRDIAHSLIVDLE